MLPVHLGSIHRVSVTCHHVVLGLESENRRTRRPQGRSWQDRKMGLAHTPALVLILGTVRFRGACDIWLKAAWEVSLGDFWPLCWEGRSSHVPLSAQALWLTFHSCTCRQRDCDPCCLFGGDGCCLGFGTECGRRENNLSGNPMIIKGFHNCVRRPEKINPKEARVAFTHCF